MVGDIPAAGEPAELPRHALLAVSFVVVELVQIGIVVKMAGFLDHVSAVLLRRMDAGGEVEQVQVIHQMPDLSGILRTGQLHHGAQLFPALLCQLIHRLRQVVEGIETLFWEVQRRVHFLGEHTLLDLKAHLLRICDTGAGHGTLDLPLCRGEVEPGDGLGVLRLQPGGQADHEHGRLVEVCREVCSVIELPQLHPVVVDHAVGGDRTLVLCDQEQGGLCAVQVFQLLGERTAAVGVHVVVTANGI